MTATITVTVTADKAGITTLRMLADKLEGVESVHVDVGSQKTINLPDPKSKSYDLGVPGNGKMTLEPTEKAPRKRRNKAEMAAARAAVAEAAEELKAVDTESVDPLADLTVPDEIEEGVIDASAIRNRPVAVKTYDLSKDVLPALQKYAAKNGREAGLNVLRKFNVKTVRDIPSDKYPELMSAIHG